MVCGLLVHQDPTCHLVAGLSSVQPPDGARASPVACLQLMSADVDPGAAAAARLVLTLRAEWAGDARALLP